jgi:hypothetical protein
MYEAWQKEIAEIGEQFLFSAAGNKKNQDLARCLGAASEKKQKIATDLTVVVVATAADDDDATRL